jgi:YesN/AraC family two-component response regulator
MPYNILLVDDDKDFQEEFKDSLEDYKVITASNGEEALQILKEPHIIDLVILDVMLPGLKGTEVLKRIKYLDPELCIIILTGHSSKSVAIEALRGHADDYIEKPLDIDSLKKNIKRLLDNKQRSGDEKDIIERVKYFAERNFDKKVCLREAAESVCLSPKYLSRLFKESTGMGFNDYKLELKINKAKELLTNTNYIINEIAYKIGYLNVESFVRMFKKLTNYTPTKFRDISS